MPLIPLANTANFFGTLSDEFWYDGTLELMRRCDAVMLVPGWEGSKGVSGRWRRRARKMPVFDRVEQLRFGLRAAAGAVTRYFVNCTAPTPTESHDGAKHGACSR